MEENNDHVELFAMKDFGQAIANGCYNTENM
jgi:hypothetical protein